MALTASSCLWVALLLFALGGVGLLLRRNALIQLMCAELMLQGANLVIVFFAKEHHALVGSRSFIIIGLAMQLLHFAVGVAVVVAVCRARASNLSDTVDVMRH